MNQLIETLDSYFGKKAPQLPVAFREFLVKNKLVKISSGNSIAYNGIKNKSLFVKNWNWKNSIELMSQNARKKHGYTSILPLELAAQLVEYSRENGRISRYIKSRISNGMDYELKHRHAIQKRIGILNRQAELAYMLRHSDFAAFFDFGYRSKKGINNWILSVLGIMRH